jgi:hypothetical protein
MKKNRTLKKLYNRLIKKIEIVPLFMKTREVVTTKEPSQRLYCCSCRMNWKHLHTTSKKEYGSSLGIHSLQVLLFTDFQTISKTRNGIDGK